MMVERRLVLWAAGPQDCNDRVGMKQKNRRV